jgi:TPR repeat protein
MPRACALIGPLIALTIAWSAMADDASEFGRYRQEAEAGERTAYYPLAERYAEGRGVPRNPIEAYALAEIAEHFLLATEDSDQPRAVALKARLAAQMSADQIAAAHRRASEIRPDLERQRKLGEIRSRELGIVLLGLAFVAVIAASISLFLRRLMFRSVR